MAFAANSHINKNLEIRSEIYNFLAMVFSKPLNAEIVSIICERTFKNVILHYFIESSLHDDFKEMYTKMTQSMTADQFLENISFLSNEFNQLFMVPGAKYIIPYESHYHLKRADIPGTILSKEISSFYKKAGFILDQKNVELPDFIGNELAFAGILLKKASKNEGKDNTLTSYYQLYSEFLKDHLLMWIPVFSEKIQEKSSSVFFKIWGIFLNKFIGKESDIVFNINNDQRS